jgi:peptide/nickel transport system permease protein
VATCWRGLHQFWNLYKQNKIGVVGLFICGFFVFVAIFAPFLSPYDPWKYGTQMEDFVNSPSWKHLLGTDDVGRDILTLVIFGARISLVIGLLSALVAAVIGSIMGLLAGYHSGMLGELIMRFTDALLCIPVLPLLIILAALLGRSIWNLILIIGLTGWTSTARIIRSETLSVKERPFIERAKAIGCSDIHIMFHHILPIVAPLVATTTVLNIAGAILYESTLSFLGLGDPAHISWGIILHYAFLCQAVTLRYWWYVIPPGICIALVIVGLDFIKMSLEDILNPRLRRR